jgi:pimeloyl-ACP methyl ester carboxylesterase
MATRIELSHATLELDDVGQGHPVILLHGFPATRYLWSRLVPPLVKAGYRLLYERCLVHTRVSRAACA